MTSKKKLKDYQGEAADKIAAGKKNAKAASKVGEKHALKKAAEKEVLAIAAELPAGQAKPFLLNVKELQEIDKKVQVLNAARRGVKAKLKGMKIKMRSFEPVYKMLTWAPEDVLSHFTHMAIYMEMMGIEISKDQKDLIDGMKANHAKNKATIIAAHGGDTGKEIGSGTDAGLKRSDISAENIADANHDFPGDAAATGRVH